MVMRIYLNGLCATGVNRFDHIFTSFYARQWYDDTNDVTGASLTVVDRQLIKALRIEKGWRCGSNDCGISCQTVETTHVFKHERTYEQPFLLTMSTSTNKHRYKINCLAYYFRLYGGKHCAKLAILSLKFSYILSASSV